MARDVRVCLDLNVWYRRLLNAKRGMSGSASQRIFDIVASGRYADGGVQLVVSHTMLSRLETALVRNGIAPSLAAQYVAAIEAIARVGVYREPTSIVLGGGFHPTRDAVPMRYDPYDDAFAPPRIDAEDGRALDTALAGRADLLVTNDMADFAVHSDEIAADRIRIKATADRTLVVVGERDALAYLQCGRIPDIGDILDPALLEQFAKIGKGRP